MVETVPSTKIGQMYKDHIEMILKKDIEGLLDQYDPEATLISSFEKVPRVFHGREQLREHFNGILGIEGLETSIGFWGEVNDMSFEGTNIDLLMITEAITLKLKGDRGSLFAKMRFADSWVIRNGKILVHFAGMVQYTDGSLS